MSSADQDLGVRIHPQWHPPLTAKQIVDILRPSCAYRRSKLCMYEVPEVGLLDVPATLPEPLVSVSLTGVVVDDACTVRLSFPNAVSILRAGRPNRYVLYTEKDRVFAYGYVGQTGGGLQLSISYLPFGGILSLGDITLHAGDTAMTNRFSYTAYIYPCWYNFSLPWLADKINQPYAPAALADPRTGAVYRDVHNQPIMAATLRIFEVPGLRASVTGFVYMDRAKELACLQFKLPCAQVDSTRRYLTLCDPWPAKVKEDGSPNYFIFSNALGSPIFCGGLNEGSGTLTFSQPEFTTEHHLALHDPVFDIR